MESVLDAFDQYLALERGRSHHTRRAYRGDLRSLFAFLDARVPGAELSSLTLPVLRAAAAWREAEAQRIDIPRGRLVKDETLLEVAATAPNTPDDLARARGISEGFARGKSGAALLAGSG